MIWEKLGFPKQRKTTIHLGAGNFRLRRVGQFRLLTPTPPNFGRLFCPTGPTEEGVNS